ncbi:MAG: UDP-N-acetylglucosamine diphosphorylase [Clostridiales Family XIII bacterium]|jgi:bifunctional UDP-N-acetylglucosamine pyrophosphorylase/glucosamine-1-phosphate N-acetyltransferase|nr:UDP-N-acetylglucosamine diphosphorylase [Clostridiales Family XIII bacterium]
MENFDVYEREAEERLRINRGLADKGVRFTDIRAAYIDEGASIGAGSLIGPCVVIEGDTRIGENCRIGQNTRIRDSLIEDGAEVEQSVIVESRVGARSRIGPFAYLRPGSDIGEDAKVGDFVEVKNSSLGKGSKASHLTYIGDSDLGDGVNLGCGVVFVNYDGREKHRSTVGDGAFIGCNVNIVSPVSVGRGSYVAAGTTVTVDVPEGALSVGRAKQRNLEGWAARRGRLAGRRPQGPDHGPDVER